MRWNGRENDPECRSAYKGIYPFRFSEYVNALYKPYGGKQKIRKQNAFGFLNLIKTIFFPF